MIYRQIQKYKEDDLFCKSLFIEHTPTQISSNLLKIRLAKCRFSANRNYQGIVPPSDEGGGFCVAKDGGREKVKNKNLSLSQLR